MAKKNVSVFVSAVGSMAAFWTALTKAVKDRGGSDEDIYRLTTPAGEKLINKFADLIVGTCAEVFRVVVDYSQTLADMIGAGKYDWVNSDITQEHFPIQGQGTSERDLVLVHLNRNASTEDVLRDIDSRGLKPESIESLLAFGAKFPEKQREFPIVALGSVWRHPDGGRDVACLYESASKRKLVLYWYGDDCIGRCRFLASRK